MVGFFIGLVAEASLNLCPLNQAITPVSLVKSATRDCTGLRLFALNNNHINLVIRWFASEATSVKCVLRRRFTEVQMDQSRLRALVSHTRFKRNPI